MVAEDSRGIRSTPNSFACLRSIPNSFACCCSAAGIWSNGDFIFVSPGVDQQSFDGLLSNSKVVRKKDAKKRQRKKFKAECKAQQLLQVLLGFDQWKIYRKTNIVAVRGKSIWLIGDVFKSYDKFHPFRGKPDVVRIDVNRERLWGKFLALTVGIPSTNFCIDPDMKAGGMPYSDKVMSYVVHCSYDEKGFYKLANRLGERTLKSIPDCALYDPRQV